VIRITKIFVECVLGKECTGPWYLVDNKTL